MRIFYIFLVRYSKVYHAFYKPRLYQALLCCGLYAYIFLCVKRFYCMSKKTFCHCVDCKCSAYCFYSNNRKEIDYTLLDSVVIDAACRSAHCHFMSDITPAPTTWQGYEPCSRFEFLFRKYLPQISRDLEVAEVVAKKFGLPPVFKKFLTEYLPDYLTNKEDIYVQNCLMMIDRVLAITNF